MQPVFSALPELHSFRKNAVSAPKIWNRRIFASELFLDLFDAVVEFTATGNYFALGGNNCTQPTAKWSFIEVNLRFFTTHLLYGPLDLDLTLQPRPMKIQPGPRILRELFSFTTLVIRKENQTLLIKSFYQDHPARRTPIVRCRSPP